MPPSDPTALPELFDLEADPYAESNVIADHQDIAQDLHAKLIQWLRDIDAPPAAIDVYM